MSRHLRKLFGSNTLPPADGDSDEEFAPLYAANRPSFAGLVTESSDSESEGEAKALSSSEEEEAVVRKPNNKKNRQKQAQRTSTSTEDEVERSVREVNALLGEPTYEPPVVKPVDMKKTLFGITGKKLNYENELVRRFLIEPEAERQNARRPRKNVTRAFIVPPILGVAGHKPSWRIVKLDTENPEDDSLYFRIDHYSEYQQAHRQYIKIMKEKDSPIDVENLRKIVHIEGLIDYSDFLYRTQDFSAAKNVLEMILAYFQYKAHERFNWSDQRVRLLYEYTTNRPIHVTLLRYAYVVSSRACHRTALELCKLMLNLDPSDPLGVAYLIDIMALRARDYNWLISYVEYWTTNAQGYSVLSLNFSYALAHFHLALQSGDKEHSRADEQLQNAIMEFPYFAKMLLLELKPQSPLLDHELLKEDRMSHTAENFKLTDTMKIAVRYFVKTVLPMWREMPVERWFLKTLKDLTQLYDVDEDIRMWVEIQNDRNGLQNSICPVEVLRHLHVMRHMADSLLNWDYKVLPYFSPLFDPHPKPENNKDLYGYGALEREEKVAARSLLYTMITSIVPAPQDVQYYNR